VEGKPVLTTADFSGFESDGGMLSFFETNGKVRFRINLEAAERAKLRINPQLLQVAQIVHTQRADAAISP
jgi:hypothetical protein